MKAKELICLSTSVYKLDERNIFKKRPIGYRFGKWVIDNEVKIIVTTMLLIIAKEIFILTINHPSVLPYAREIFGVIKQ